MSERSIEGECVCMRLDERKVSGMTVIVLHGNPCNVGWRNTELFSGEHAVYTYAI